MSDRLQITDARDEDRAFIIECIGGLQDHEVALHDTRLQTSAAPLERYFEAISTRAQANGGAVLVAWAQDGPVGFICFWIDHASTLLETADSNRSGYISDIYVVDAFRGHGVARRLMDEAKRRRLMKVSSVTRLRVCTLAANQLAVAAYEGAGFEPYEITFETRLR